MTMLEENPFGGGNLNDKSKIELERNGVEFSWSNSSYSLTHQKSIVIDSKELFLLNQNLTTSAFERNREFNVLNTDPEDVIEAKEIFTKDWNRESFYLSGKSNLIVSPLNSREVITDLIRNAEEKIVIEMEVMADNKIIDLLIEKSKEVDVRIILPPKEEISSNKLAVEKFKQNGMQIKRLKNPYIHSKLILVDNEKAYVGSINMSSQSMDENREMGIILTEAQSIVTLYSIFEKDWQSSTKID
jgi:phosphatidylserine/phosphatidylglycerophosphate/cardiolipin synthase-like enzyme